MSSKKQNVKSNPDNNIHEPLKGLRKSKVLKENLNSLNRVMMIIFV